MNKFDDLKACLDSLKHEYLVTVGYQKLVIMYIIFY